MGQGRHLLAMLHGRLQALRPLKSWELALYHFDRYRTEQLVMAKLASTLFGWTKSVAADVTGYRLRIGQGLDYDDAGFDVGNVDQVNIAAIPEIPPDLDGVFDLALSAVDDSGNESDLARLAGVPLDLVPPDAPINFRRL